MNRRRDPDRLLNQMQPDAVQEGRGKLKIFLGYAAGVGKSYAMLQAAGQRRAEGVDVVVGYIETHGRAETDALLEGMEVVPRRAVVYQGATLTEMDTDAVLARRPQLVLVDELAHTNTPGLRHARRYQDVLELLDSGIDVYTTVNIQELESLNDVVSQVTGTSVRETVPDYILDEAHEIELIDLPVNELLSRLEAGKVYIPNQAERAMSNFFRPGNLAALREMALRRAAERVDEQMRAYMQSHAIAGPWPATERLLVCVSPSPLSQRLVRSACRLARGLDAEWIAAYVETPGHASLSEADAERVAQTLRLAEKLGAQTVQLSGQAVAETIVDYALSRNVTKIIAGKPLRPRWREWLHGSIIDQIVRRSQDIDVYVISGKPAPPGRPVRLLPAAPATPGWRPYLLSAGLVAAATLVGLPLRPFINPTNLVMLYLVGVMVAAVRLGRRHAVAASLLSVLVFDMIFVPPYYTLIVTDAQYLLTFAGLLAVGLTIGTLAAQVREQALSARRREAQTAALYELSRSLGTASTLTETAQTAVKHLQATFEHAALFLADQKDERLVLQAATPAFQLEADGYAAADWVFRHGQPAGRYTETLAGVRGYYLPLLTSGQIIGVMCIHFPADYKGAPAGELKRLLASFASQIALALAKARLAEQAQHARLLEETEKLQTTLLNSISHDLRTPLASITGALSSLLDDADLLSEAARSDLAQTAWEEALRLNRLVGNLLDMTRLESGAMKVVCQPCDVAELVGATLGQMPNRLRGRTLRRLIPPDLPPVAIDFALMVQALMNLVDNTVKYAPAEEPIEIEARREGGGVVIAVKDRGPGLPEAELEHIFNKFFRLTSSGAGGTGLGLSIARGIVEAHHGRLWAENRSGGGAVFSMFLPLARQESS